MSSIQRREDGIMVDHPVDVWVIGRALGSFMFEHEAEINEEITGLTRSVERYRSLRDAGMDPGPIPEMTPEFSVASQVRWRAISNSNVLPISFDEAPLVADILRDTDVLAGTEIPSFKARITDRIAGKVLDVVHHHTSTVKSQTITSDGWSQMLNSKAAKLAQDIDGAIGRS